MQPFDPRSCLTWVQVAILLPSLPGNPLGQGHLGPHCRIRSRWRLAHMHLPGACHVFPSQEWDADGINICTHCLVFSDKVTKGPAHLPAGACASSKGSSLCHLQVPA